MVWRRLCRQRLFIGRFIFSDDTTFHSQRQRTCADKCYLRNNDERGRGCRAGEDNITAFLDPQITYDLSADAGITLELSAGVGNTPLTATPLPAALPLFATGLGALGLLGWHRKRKQSPDQEHLSISDRPPRGGLSFCVDHVAVHKSAFGT